VSVVVAALAGLTAYGRLLLVAGLVVGAAMPGLALVIRGWLPELVALLLFVAALRIGPRQALGVPGDLRLTLTATLVFQLVLPVVLALLAAVFGWTGPLVSGLILMLAASPISGSPNLVVMLGHEPSPALRQLVLGTMLLPATSFVVLLMAPGFGQAGSLLIAALWLLGLIAVAGAIAFIIRVTILKHPSRDAVRIIDGSSAVVMAAGVVGLMSAIGTSWAESPASVLIMLAVAFAANFGLQIAAALLLRGRAGPALVSLAVIAGNRNIALFLTALPLSVTDPLLLFIGCYQIPMYLTPILLSRFYTRIAPRG